MMATSVSFLRLEKMLREKILPTIRHFRTRHSRIILPVFLTLFLVGFYYSARTSGIVISDVRIAPLLGALIGAVVTVAFNAWGLQLLGAYSAVRVPFREALTVSSIGSLSNFLPIPGSMLVRGGALVARGATVKQSVTGIALAGFLWIGLAGLLTGLALAAQESSIGLPAVVVFGIASVFAFGRLVRQGGVRLAALFLVQRLAMLLTMVIRFWFGFYAVGISANFTECATFAVVGVFGAVVAIAPAGLAVSEMMAAALANLTALSPAATFIVVALNRIVGLLVNGIICAAMNFSFARE
jgi:hypothetical protein